MSRRKSRALASSPRPAPPQSSATSRAPAQLNAAGNAPRIPLWCRCVRVLASVSLRCVRRRRSAASLRRTPGSPAAITTRTARATRVALHLYLLCRPGPARRARRAPQRAVDAPCALMASPRGARRACARTGGRNGRHNGLRQCCARWTRAPCPRGRACACGWPCSTRSREGRCCASAATSCPSGGLSCRSRTCR